MLTEKCKEMFHTWFKNYMWDDRIPNGDYQKVLNEFEKQYLSMQFGVYVDFADSLGIDIMMYKDYVTDDKIVYGVELNEDLTNIYCFVRETRNEARLKVIEMFNKYINKNY